MNFTRSLRITASAAGFVLLLSACGSGGDSGGVASLAGTEDVAASGTDAGAGDGATTEEKTLAWVECMREEGLDIADPTVDQDGNLVLGGGRGGPPAGGGAAAAGGGQPDRETFSKATEKCGSPPQTGGGFNEEDRQAAQDSMLELAQCLRAAGFDVADPDFSSQGPGGAPRAAETDGSTDSGPRGPFGDLDMDDPAVQAAMTSCQAELGTTFPGGRGPRATTGDNN